MNIDHICIAVRSIDRAAIRLSELFGYSVATGKVLNTLQNVNVQFLKKDNSLDIKLIEPGNRDSDLINFLKKREGLHHICFKSDDVWSSVKEFEKKGARVLSPPQPGEAFDDELITFLYAGHGLNVEVIDTDKRRNVTNTTTESSLMFDGASK